ncbi:hypothetical protein [Ligilactobacillus salitolerans]|uniref:hypothetical protein n=1 Tax=Ligilactobacillus salitolerans TaxID=1808352 RepID=UPI001E483DE6|nr:hypothetical protein [Ligilactobacillus salitolerans]
MLILVFTFIKKIERGAISALYSWLMIILAVIFFITIDFLYLSNHINGTTIENGYFKSIITIIISLLSSWFISKGLSSLFLNSPSEVVVANLFGFILIIVALIGFLLLFSTARHDIIAGRKTIQEAQKKYFGHNQALTFVMVHYVIGISSVVLINSIIYLPIFLDFLIPIPKSYPGNIEKSELQELIAFIITLVIPCLIVVFTPFSLRKLLSHFDK